MSAIANDQYDEAIRIVTRVIDTSTDKKQIIDGLKNRIKAAFENNDFQSKKYVETLKYNNLNLTLRLVVLKDCKRLKDIDYPLDNDKRFLMFML
ncbi:unnamed protein product [Rotaria sp. Silwood1]|nr:unnamed protein product [Rotaria sp. Silwood1]CAF1660310.1 unnamed protein product [Rotaria sp. Silwood1]CAF3802251.1 unnamed protein product [Rotaria sp. Silwood1]CAF3824510.1 unnamed protein product [Rotaria sp. Silwood1]CAF3848771.1 unnamed protein product [Rotaria sp. Silwood1]